LPYATEDEVVRTTREELPEYSSTQSLTPNRADRFGISTDTVVRICGTTICAPVNQEEMARIFSVPGGLNLGAVPVDG
jgi:hypothetical protein